MWGRQARSYRRAPPGVRPPANPFLVALPLSAGQSGAERGHFEAAGCAAWKRPEASERAHVAAAQRFDAWNRAALAQRAPVLPTQWLVAGVSEPWDYVTNYGALQTEQVRVLGGWVVEVQPGSLSGGIAKQTPPLFFALR